MLETIAMLVLISVGNKTRVELHLVSDASRARRLRLDARASADARERLKRATKHFVREGVGGRVSSRASTKSAGRGDGMRAGRKGEARRRGRSFHPPHPPGGGGGKKKEKKRKKINVVI